MKLCSAVILYRDDNNVGISFTDNLQNRLMKFTIVSFKRFEAISLPSSMTKLQALKHLKTLNVYEDQFFKELIDNKIGKYLNKLEVNSVDANTVLSNVDTKFDVTV